MGADFVAKFQSDAFAIGEHQAKRVLEEGKAFRSIEKVEIAFSFVLIPAGMEYPFFDFVPAMVQPGFVKGFVIHSNEGIGAFADGFFTGQHSFGCTPEEAAIKGKGLTIDPGNVGNRTVAVVAVLKDDVPVVFWIGNEMKGDKLCKPQTYKLTAGPVAQAKTDFGRTPVRHFRTDDATALVNHTAWSDVITGKTFDFNCIGRDGRRRGG